MFLLINFFMISVFAESPLNIKIDALFPCDENCKNDINNRVPSIISAAQMVAENEANNFNFEQPKPEFLSRRARFASDELCLINTAR